MENSIRIRKTARSNIRNNAAGGYAMPISPAKNSRPSRQIEKKMNTILDDSHNREYSSLIFLFLTRKRI